MNLSEQLINLTPEQSAKIAEIAKNLGINVIQLLEDNNPLDIIASYDRGEYQILNE